MTFTTLILLVFFISISIFFLIYLLQYLFIYYFFIWPSVSSIQFFFWLNSFPFKIILLVIYCYFNLFSFFYFLDFTNMYLLISLI